MTCEIQDWTIEYYEKNTKDCNDFLKVPENYDKIPLLNAIPLYHFREGSLVRYQGMVQDMLNPEFYYANYTVLNQATGESVVNSGKFRDIKDCGENDSLMIEDTGNFANERQVYFCIPLPGLNSWVQKYQEKTYGANNNARQSTPAPCNSPEHPARKITAADRERDDEMETEGEMETSAPTLTETHTNKKKVQVPVDNNSTSVSYSNEKYFPLPGEIGIPCIVKVYHEDENSKILLNDRIEVVGFLSLNPALEATWEGSDAADRATHPPPSSVPRIHSITVKKLEHCNPLLKNDSLANVRSEAGKTRSDLHLVLTQLLYGDAVAADYVICHLLSRIYIRNDWHTLGQFSLNISNIVSLNYAKKFYDIFECLVTNSQYIPLSVSVLNEESFIPKKDYETNRLWSGRLQLCDDTHLIIDETQMKEGQLNHMGCLNLAALQTVIRDQEISYDFGYYPVKYNTNIPVLILSEGKSMLETNVRLKLKPDLSMDSTIDETFEAAKFFLNGKLSDEIRMYLSSMRLHEFEVSEDMASMIGDDYALLRQKDNRVATSDLHILIVLSRLLALSNGRTVLIVDDWKRAIEMETERRARSSA